MRVLVVCVDALDVEAVWVDEGTQLFREHCVVVLNLVLQLVVAYTHG